MAGEDPEQIATVTAAELRCPNCGAPWTMRGFNTTRTLACEHCGAVIDTSAEKWQLVEKVEGAYQARPRYALGTRGKFDDVTWEVIGWCERAVRAYGQKFSWEEHLLYNPYEGFRYLIYQDGHWVWVTPLPGAPTARPSSASYEETTYKHFSTGKAVVEEVLGEFPWEVRRGDVAKADDYVDPPFMLSSEQTEDELTWSRGVYVEGDVVAKAFGKPTREVSAPHGVHPCRPNPHKPLAAWMLKITAIAILGWLFFAFVYLAARDSREVWSGSVPVEGDSYEVELTEGGAVEVTATAPVMNSWVFMNVMLVGPQGQSEHAVYGGVELEYYSGPDWSEGSGTSTTLVGAVPAGKYVLQVTHHPESTFKGPVRVLVREDVPAYRYVCCSWVLLLIVPLLVIMRSASFEQRRWAESDHA